MATNLDIRQSQTRTLQDQLNSAATTQMDSTLASINNELTTPGRLIAAATPSLVVTVGSGTVVNPNTGKNRVTPLINNTFPNFTGGTITFPSTSGTITVSPGTNGTITIGASQFCAVLVQLNAAGQLSLVVGTAAGSLGSVVIPGGSTSLLSLGYIIVQTNGSSVIQNVTNAMLYQFSGGGGAGSGSGSGTGDDLDALQFRASFTELFTDLPTGSTSSINLTTGFTNATYSTSLNMYTGSYDASKTIASGTNSNTVVVSSAPSFTVKAGDIVVTGTQAAKITTVNSQTNYTVETLSTVPSIGAQVTVSQAVHTIDIYNSTVGGQAALSSSFPGTTMSEVLIDYKDNSSSTSNVFTPDTGPFAGFTASVDNSNWSTVQDRPQLSLTQQQSTITPTSGSDLYLRFFSVATSGTGVFSLIMYKAFMQKAVSAASNYNAVWSAYGTTNNSTTPINCTVSVNGGKTTITLTNGNQYPIGVLSGQTVGSLEVLLNGQKLPRFVSGSVPATDAFYTEVSSTVLQLDRDYSSQQLDVQVTYSLTSLDSSSTNTTAITNINASQFKNYLINGNLDIWQRGTSTTVANGASAYQADRFYVKNSLGTTGVITYSQTTGVNPGTKFGASVQITTAPTASQANGTELYQVIENFNTLDLLAGLTASAQVQIKALGLVNQVGIQFAYATTETKPTLFFGIESLVTVNTTNFTLGTLLGQTLNSATITTSGVVGIRIRITGVSSGQLYALNNGFIVEQAMVNIGGSIAPFSRAGRNIQEEIQLCQRYYEKSYDLTTAPGAATTTGMVAGAEQATGSWAYLQVFYKVNKRTSGTTISFWDASGNSGKVSVISAAGDARNDNQSMATNQSPGSTGTAFGWDNATGSGQSVAFQWALDVDI